MKGDYMASKEILKQKEAVVAEISERLDNPAGLFIGTIHSLANYYLRAAGIDTSRLLNDDKFCISCANYCINRLGMQTTDYTNWLSNIGSLSCLGYDGEELAIQLSRQSRGYKSDEDVLKTLKRLSDNQRNRQYLTRYFKMCKESLGKYWIQEIKKMYEQNNHTYKTDQINFDNHSLINL
jgi:hypothetical protein